MLYNSIGLYRDSDEEDVDRIKARSGWSDLQGRTCEGGRLDLAILTDPGRRLVLPTLM